MKLLVAQFQEKKRASGFVILSAAKDLSPDRDPSLRSELALERSEGMTLLHRLRLTRKTSSLKWIDPCSRLRWCEPGINTAWRKPEAPRAATLPRSRRLGPSVHGRGDPLSPRVAQSVGSDTSWERSFVHGLTGRLRTTSPKKQDFSMSQHSHK